MHESYVTLHRRREIEGASYSREFQRRRHATPDIISRLGLEATLAGHNGCVNCLEWSQDGRLLASGSDDCSIILWAAHEHRKITKFQTIHSGNLFSVKFMPRSGNRLVAVSSGDSKISLVDVEARRTLHTFTNHRNRVKRLAVAEDEPHLLFSASEDGTVMQFDLRCSEKYAKDNADCVLIDHTRYQGPQAEAKCLAICPTRTVLLAVGCSDPYVRLYDRRMLHCTPTPRSETSDETRMDYEISSDCVRYFVPGHVPDRVADYSRRFRMLTATYVTFSPDGRDLLVNLGGEQIYLYDVNNKRKSYRLELANNDASSCPNTDCVSQVGQDTNSNANGYRNMTLHYAPFVLTNRGDASTNHCPAALPKRIEKIKRQANQQYEAHNYAQSIELYNKAIALYGSSSVLHSNRAAALLKRNWDGDTYAAANDCMRSIQLNCHQHKAYYRLCTSLITLGREREATDCFNHFKELYPESTGSESFAKLRSNLDEMKLISKKCSSGKGLDVTDTDDEESADSQRSYLQEKIWKERANDYSQRFCGHCNTTTDIKEANFIGDNGQYIVAGSDDGSFFIWDRKTTNIVRTMRGDDCIVNCVQPHPETCLMASSGIDTVVRLWSPLPEGAIEDRSVENAHAAANLNQRRMNSDPLELMLMNMGQTIRRSDESDNDDSGDMQCRPF
ncbi:WD and tetratricopeptide repeats protein 1-like isoform X2 [Watersipora subatra]|uniref:WD and tetratricopeptide repeats protein 1-like isoform X2 n=1 Tax=Watersipora subatra TaxID=2589382 RepID=UPI00355C4B16